MYVLLAVCSVLHVCFTLFFVYLFLSFGVQMAESVMVGDKPLLKLRVPVLRAELAKRGCSKRRDKAFDKLLIYNKKKFVCLLRNCMHLCLAQ